MPFLDVLVAYALRLHFSLAALTLLKQENEGEAVSHSVGACIYILFFPQQAVVLLTILIGNVLATPFVMRNPPMQQISFAKPVHNPNLDTCKLCINFADQFINQLLNIILSMPSSTFN